MSYRLSTDLSTRLAALTSISSFDGFASKEAKHIGHGVFFDSQPDSLQFHNAFASTDFDPAYSEVRNENAVDPFYVHNNSDSNELRYLDGQLELDSISLGDLGSTSAPRVFELSDEFTQTNYQQAYNATSLEVLSTANATGAPIEWNIQLGRDIGGGPGDDTINGGPGNDTISGGLGNDSLLGLDGDDFLFGNSGNDTLEAGAGDDFLSGYNGHDVLSGGSGSDHLTGGRSNDHLQGNNGNDTLYGNSGNDTLEGGNDDDFLSGYTGNDSLSGGRGNDTIYGGGGNDRISGNSGNDTMFGGNGNDRIINFSGESYISGGRGNDYIWGSGYNDSLYGNSGDDTIIGGNGDNFLSGYSGDDKLYSSGQNDTLSGGSGADVFHFYNYCTDCGEHHWVITDFEPGVDQLYLLEGFSRYMNDIDRFEQIVRQEGNDVVFDFYTDLPPPYVLPSTTLTLLDVNLQDLNLEEINFFIVFDWPS